MLPLGVANSNLGPRPSNPPAPTAPATSFGQSDLLNSGPAVPSANVPAGRYQLDGTSGSPILPGGTNFFGANPPPPPPPPRSLGSEGGLFQTIQQGSSVGLGGIHQQVPASGSSNYPASSGNYPASLSSSGSLATLGIAVPSNFDGSSSAPSDPANTNQPSASSGDGRSDTVVQAPAVLPNKETARSPHHGISPSPFFFEFNFEFSKKKLCFLRTCQVFKTVLFTAYNVYKS